MNTRSGILWVVLLSAVFISTGCSPGSFVNQEPGWKVIELREDMSQSYDKAWQVAVDTIARQWDIEILDKDSGYLRTSWKYGIGGVSGDESEWYKGRLVMKFDTVSRGNPSSLQIKTDASWYDSYGTGKWLRGYDLQLQRDVYEVLSARLGRTAPE